MRKLLHGVGTYEKGEYVAYHLGKQSKEYCLWTSMLRRCYSENCHLRYPTYLCCSVSDNFKNFQYFAEWCQSQVGFGSKDYTLDKDIIFKGNKIYSETSCVFVPQQINKIFNKRDAERGEWPIGVVWHALVGKFKAQCSVEGKNIHLGLFSNPEDAYIVYKVAKEIEIKRVAEEYKNQIDPRVYEALMSYTVEDSD